MNFKKRFKLKPIIVGTWVNVTPFCRRSLTNGCHIKINDSVFLVVKTRHCGIKIVERKK